MAPRDAGIGAGRGDGARQDGVAHDAIRLVQFAGVDVGLAGVAGGVDEEFRPVPAQRGGELGGAGVVEFRPAQAAKGQAAAMVPGRTALPMMHSALCSSQASTLGLPV